MKARCAPKSHNFHRTHNTFQTHERQTNLVVCNLFTEHDMHPIESQAVDWFEVLSDNSLKKYTLRSNIGATGFLPKHGLASSNQNFVCTQVVGKLPQALIGTTIERPNILASYITKIGTT